MLERELYQGCIEWYRGYHEGRNRLGKSPKISPKTVYALYVS